MTTTEQAVEHSLTYEDYLVISKQNYIRIITKYAAPKGAKVPEKRDNYEKAVR